MYSRLFLLTSFMFLLFLSNVFGAAGDLIGSYNYSGYTFSKSSVSVDQEGNIYSSGGKHLFSLASDITYKWTRDAEGINTYIRHSPVIGPNGTIYFGTKSGIGGRWTNDGLYAYDKAGNRQWIFDKGGDIDFGPAVTPDGTIYVATLDSGEDLAIPALYAVNPDGTEKWQYAVGAKFNSGPAIDAEGNILVVFDGALHSISPDVTPNWSANLIDSDLNGPLSISDAGDVYFAAGHTLYAYSKEGGLKWSFIAESYINTPAIDSEGNLYFADGKKACALDEHGNVKWIFEASNDIRNTPAIGADGTIIFTGTDSELNKIYALNNDGTLKWDVYSFDRLSSPVIGSNGNLYITADEKVHVYETETGGAAASGWPMIRQNIRNTSASANTAAASPPSVPTLTATTEGLRVDISWDSIPNADGYTFSYAPSSPYEGPHTITSLEVGKGTNFSPVLWHGARFYIVVQAHNKQGRSGYSNILEVVVE